MEHQENQSLLEKDDQPNIKTEEQLKFFISKKIQNKVVDIHQIGSLYGKHFQNLKRTGKIGVGKFGAWLQTFFEVQKNGSVVGFHNQRERSRKRVRTERKSTGKAREDKQKAFDSEAKFQPSAALHGVPPAAGYHSYQRTSSTPHGFLLPGSPMHHPFAYGPLPPQVGYGPYSMYGTQQIPPPVYGMAWGQPVMTAAMLNGASCPAFTSQRSSRQRSRAPKRRKRSVSSAHSDCSSYTMRSGSSSGSSSSMHSSRKGNAVSDVLDTVRATLHGLSSPPAHDQTHDGPPSPPLNAETHMTPLKEWLSNLDSGQGAFLQYLDALQCEFNDLQQLAASVQSIAEGRSMVEAVDPIVWEALGVKSLGHKLVLARAIVKLAGHDRDS